MDHVNAVVMNIGEVSTVVPEYLQDCWRWAADREDMLRGCELKVNVMPAVTYCEDCGQEYGTVEHGKTCPYCGAPIPQLADKCPECGQYITPEASDDLKEIIDNLEEALVDMKSGKDLAKSKATVERYVRKAKMYFSNNPKIKPLLAEVEAEMAEAENKARSLHRSEMAKSVVTNKWFWCAVPMVLGIIFVLICVNTKEESAQLAFGAIGAFAIMGGIYGLMFAGGLHKD